MSTEINIHDAQTAILRELLFKPTAKFSELRRAADLDSDHFNFHLQRLVELKLVAKTENGYKLTVKGKEYANKLDTDNNTIERQPKVAVVLIISRQNNGRQEFVFQQRRKNPYFGFWGRPTGKVRWGETIAETAKRECLEETGLDGDFQIKGVYHELVKLEGDHEAVEDKIFFLCSCENPTGDFIAEFEGGHNEWLAFDELLDGRKIFANFKNSEVILDGGKYWFDEATKRYAKDEF